MKIRAPSREGDNESGFASAVVADQDHGFLTRNLGGGGVNLQEVVEIPHGLRCQRPLHILEELLERRLAADLFPSARHHKTPFCPAQPVTPAPFTVGDAGAAGHAFSQFPQLAISALQRKLEIGDPEQTGPRFRTHGPLALGG